MRGLGFERLRRLLISARPRRRSAALKAISCLAAFSTARAFRGARSEMLAVLAVAVALRSSPDGTDSIVRQLRADPALRRAVLLQLSEFPEAGPAAAAEVFGGDDRFVRQLADSSNSSGSGSGSGSSSSSGSSSGSGTSDQAAGSGSESAASGSASDASGSASGYAPPPPWPAYHSFFEMTCEPGQLPLYDHCVYWDWSWTGAWVIILVIVTIGVDYIFEFVEEVVEHAANHKLLYVLWGKVRLERAAAPHPPPGRRAERRTERRTERRAERMHAGAARARPPRHRLLRRRRAPEHHPDQAVHRDGRRVDLSLLRVRTRRKLRGLLMASDGLRPSGHF